MTTIAQDTWKELAMTETSIMPEGMDDFEDLFLAFLESEAEKEAKIKEKAKVIYHEIFDKMPPLDKINNFIRIEPWLDCIKEYLHNNPSVVTELGISDARELRSYINPFFIGELSYNFEFIALDLDKLDLPNEDIELWNKSGMFKFVTRLWLVTIGDTDCIVQKLSGPGKDFFFLTSLDDFIMANYFANENLSADELNKFNKQFTEFALKHKSLKGISND